MKGAGEKLAPILGHVAALRDRALPTSRISVPGTWFWS